MKRNNIELESLLGNANHAVIYPTQEVVIINDDRHIESDIDSSYIDQNPISLPIYSDKIESYNISLIFFMMVCCACCKNKYTRSLEKYKMSFIIKFVEKISKYRAEVDVTISKLCERNADTQDYSGIFTIEKMTANPALLNDNMMIEILRLPGSDVGGIEWRSEMNKFRSEVEVLSAHNEEDSLNKHLAKLIHFMGANGLKINLSMFWGRNDAGLTEHEEFISIISKIMDKEGLKNYDKKILLTVYYKYIMCRSVEKELINLAEINMMLGERDCLLMLGPFCAVMGATGLLVGSLCSFLSIFFGVGGLNHHHRIHNIILAFSFGATAICSLIVGGTLSLLPLISFFIFKSFFNSSDAIEKKFSNSEDKIETLYKEAELLSEQPQTLFCERKSFPNLNLFPPINDDEIELRNSLRQFSEDIALSSTSSSKSNPRKNFVDIKISCTF